VHLATVTPLRPSPIAGTWYEGRPEALARAVDSYMDRAELPKLEGELIGVVAPHAGHRYSGPVAGYAFAAARGLSPGLVAVIAPMHQPYDGSLLTTAHTAYATPLGSVPVDEQAVHALDARLKESLGLGLTPVAYDQEHSLEIELPFLQRALAAPFSLLPVMVRAVAPPISRALGSALAETLLGRDFLLVASTDLSHYRTQQVAEAMDSEMLARLEALDPDGLFDTEATGRGQACGLGALAAVLWAARDLGADRVNILRHATSGDVTGDYSAVVGYGAAAIYRGG
jgi:hypothetical protein